MTRLAEVKQERDTAKSDAWTQHMCLLLSLTEKPQHTERFSIPGDTFRYVIKAYGLTRADGGYVVIRGIHPGQRDNISGYRFDDWMSQSEHWHVSFRIAGEHIAATRNRLLRAELNR